MKLPYHEYISRRNALENLIPDKRDIDNDRVPHLVNIKAAELRLVILGAIAELNQEGWDDDE